MVSFEGGWKEKVGAKDFVKVVQYKPLGNRQWEWNEAELWLHEAPRELLYC